MFGSGIGLEASSKETEKERSGRVASCPHITDPKTARYGLSLIVSLSESVIVLSRIIPVGSGVFLGPGRV